VIGLAIKKLYEESLHDRTLADLLDGVLSQEPTPQQTTDFQSFIKVARKQIKSETGSARHSSQSTRPSSSRRTGAVKDSFDASGKSKLPPKTDNPSSLPQDIITATENISTNEGNPPKRRKTSRSVSTSSSLSSLPSIDQDLSLLTKGDQASTSEPTINSLPVNQPLLRSKRKPISAAAQQFIDSIPSINSIPRRPDLSLSDEEEQLLNEEEEYQKTKGSLRKAFPDFKTLDSNIRDEPHPSKRPQVLSAKPKPAFILTQPRPPTAASRKRKHDDDDNIHSPTSSHGELLIQPPPGARATSRGATPNPSGRPTKRIKAARVKMSPVKKKSGITGTGRTGVRKGAKLNYAEELEVDNNEDACTACGGNGKLLCCDKCPSAFHFSCVDPPLDEDNPPEGEWLCNKCKSKHDHPNKKSRGLFSSLMENIEKQNPSIFSLPYELRDRYEGVKTGEKGEYQEYTDVGTKIKAKTFDEAKAELLKLKDKAGKTILCYHCRGSALGGRPIISCDYCPLKWHLDCLDPPLAAPPVKQPSGNPRHTWMCPNHVDHELRAIDKSVRAAGESNPAGKVFKLRKPKRAKYIEPAISRGLPNNGLIDIINEPSDDEGPTIFRIAEKGLKLDFITKMKKTIEEEARREPEGRAAVNEAFDKHSFIDRQAALNLAQFALANQDLGLTPASVGELTHALIAEAPANVASLITREEKSTRLSTIPEEESTDAPVRLAPSSPPAEKSTGGTEKQSLELLQELIQRRLEAGGFLG
jgi:ribosomal protein L37AE/L43A